MLLSYDTINIINTVLRLHDTTVIVLRNTFEMCQSFDLMTKETEQGNIQY